MTIFRHYSVMKQQGNVSLVHVVDEDGADAIDATFNRFNRFTGVSTTETVRISKGTFQSAKTNVDRQIDAANEKIADLTTERASVIEFRTDALALLP